MAPIGTFIFMLAAIRSPGLGPIALCLTLCVWGAGVGAEPPPVREFSAEIVSRDAGGVIAGAVARLYAMNRKVRIETPEAPAGFFLIDAEAGTASFVRPAQRVFMDAKQSTRLTQIFVPVDLHDPCRQWQAAAKNAGLLESGGEWRCERAAPAIAGKGGAVEYNVVSPDRESSRLWIDPNLEFPVKLQTSDGASIALEHIREGVQPASLFTLPPDYRKLDPQELIDRIKRSDVWVEQSHP
jgi:hypothetical protein